MARGNLFSQEAKGAEPNEVFFGPERGTRLSPKNRIPLPNRATKPGFKLPIREPKAAFAPQKPRAIIGFLRGITGIPGDHPERVPEISSVRKASKSRFFKNNLEKDLLTDARPRFSAENGAVIGPRLRETAIWDYRSVFHRLSRFRPLLPCSWRPGGG